MQVNIAPGKRIEIEPGTRVKVWVSEHSILGQAKATVVRITPEVPLPVTVRLDKPLQHGHFRNAAYHELDLL